MRETCILFICLIFIIIDVIHGVDGVCKIQDLEKAGRGTSWSIPNKCTILDFNDVVVDSEVRGLRDSSGAPITAIVLLTRLLDSLFGGFQLNSHVNTLILSGCGIADKDIPMLVRILGEDTDQRKSESVQARATRKRAKDAGFNRNHMVLGYLKELILDRNSISDAGVQQLTNHLKESTQDSYIALNMNKLELVSLRSNRLGLKGVNDILSWATRTGKTSVNTIDLRDNALAWSDRRLVAKEPAPSDLLWWTRYYDEYSSMLITSNRKVKVYTGPRPKSHHLAVEAKAAPQLDSRSTLRYDVLLDLVRAELRHEYSVLDSPQKVEEPVEEKNNRVLGERRSEEVQEKTAAADLLLSGHEDDSGNSAEQIRERQRKHSLMQTFLEDCFQNESDGGDRARSADVGDIEAMTRSLNHLGHGTPRELLRVDYDDLSAALPALGVLKTRFLLRCVCEYNLFYEEVDRVEKIALSAHQHDDSKEVVEQRRQLDYYFEIRGNPRTNAQTKETLHGGLDLFHSRSISSIKERKEGSQYALHRESSAKKLDLTGFAGVAGDVRICESQYFRRALGSERSQVATRDKKRRDEL